MIHHPPAGRDALIAYVMGLAMACPFEQDNPCDCPLHMLRKKALGDRLAWAKSLCDDELMKIATTHCICLEKKVDLQSKADRNAQTLPKENRRKAVSLRL